MNDSKQRKIGAALSYVSIIASTLVGLLYTPFLIFKLGQSEYGLYSLVSSIIGYLTVLDLGFGNAIVVYTSKYRQKKEFDKENKLHGMFKIIYLIIGIIAGLIGIILYLNVNNMFSASMNDFELHELKIMMLILTFNLSLTFIFSLYSSIINAYEKFIFQKLLAILNTLLKPLLMIPLLFMGFKSISMCLVITFVNCIVLLSNYFYCKKKIGVHAKFSGFDKNILKVIIGYSIWLFLGTIVDRINWSVDNFVLGIVSGTAAVSVYSVAAQLNTMFVNLSLAVSGVLLPKMSKMVASNASDDDLSKEFIKVGRIQYYLIFLMASSLVLFGEQFIINWVGIEYRDAYYISLILILPLCIPLIQNLGLSILQAKNMYKFRSILLTIIAIGNILISIPLAKMYQGIGSAIGTSLSLIIGNIIIMNIYYKKRVGLNVNEFWKNIITMTLPMLMPTLFIFFFKEFVAIKGFIGITVYGIIYSLMYFLICYYYIMNDYEKNIINKIFRKLKNRNK